MKNIQSITEKATKYRWTIVVMLFFATTINYLDRQLLSLTWDEFIKPEFHWNDSHYGTITAFFSIFYAISMLFAGRFVEWMGTKKGYLWAIGIWSVGACLHAACGVVTEWHLGYNNAAELAAQTGTAALAISTFSMYAFLVARGILALGEAGNFPAAIKATAEYFPKRDRAYATSIFNSGASIGAMFAPLLIPPLAKAYGWEMAFLLIGAIGFIWMGFWVFVYDKPEESKRVNQLELDYIHQDRESEEKELQEKALSEENKIPFWKLFSLRQTWGLILGRFITDGVWWFFLFWTPSYLYAQFNIKTTDGLGMILIFTLYMLVSVLSIFGGKLPTIIINKTGQNPFDARMKAMLIFAALPLLMLLAQPLGAHFSYLGQHAAWIPVLLIAVGASAHQAWSANMYSVTGDLFPKNAIATLTGIAGMASGMGSMILQKTAGNLFEFAEKTNLTFMGFEGKPAGYFIIFCFCAVAYLMGWALMKSFIPKYKPVVIN